MEKLSKACKLAKKIMTQTGNYSHAHRLLIQHRAEAHIMDSPLKRLETSLQNYEKLLNMVINLLDPANKKKDSKKIIETLNGLVKEAEIIEQLVKQISDLS